MDMKRINEIAGNARTSFAEVWTGVVKPLLVEIGDVCDPDVGSSTLLVGGPKSGMIVPMRGRNLLHHSIKGDGSIGFDVRPTAMMHEYDLREVNGLEHASVTRVYVLVGLSRDDAMRELIEIIEQPKFRDVKDGE